MYFTQIQKQRAFFPQNNTIYLNILDIKMIPISLHHIYSATKHLYVDITEG
jgi:hypothetical protein